MSKFLTAWSGLFLAAALLLTPLNAPGYETWVYSVQLNAKVQTNPPRIDLSWLSDPYGATSYKVYRKQKEDHAWTGPIAELSGTTTNFSDTNVVVGQAWEYAVHKQGTFKAYGYIYAGIEAPLIENRGKLLLLVETNATAPLTSELATLRSDLVGDGWEVIRYGLSSNLPPASIRTLIQSEHAKDPDQLNTVLLFGHLPVFHSGNLNYDTHGSRPMPADSFYADIDGDWPEDPTNSPSYLPSDVELMVGRVDFINMPGLESPAPWPSETELLRNYLVKDHKWRHGQIAVPRKALMGNARGDDDGETVAVSGYGNFAPLVGADHIDEADTSYDPPPETRWMSMLARNSYLWTYGCGGGSPTTCGGLGTNVIGDTPGYVSSSDIVSQDAHSVFTLLFGSSFAQWDLTDNLMRTFLATPTMGLVAAAAGRPHWFVHHMAMGETIGFGARLSMNNKDLYLVASNGFPRAVYVALMGDPTLRMEPVKPPASLLATTNESSVLLSWQPSPVEVAGYHVYRAASTTGPFARISPSLLKSTSFSDTAPPGGQATYMIRAVALQSNPSGTYFNPSQGIFTTLNTPVQPEQPTQVRAFLQSGKVILFWNAPPGWEYRVQAKEAGTAWTDVSGAVQPQDAQASWEDPEVTKHTARFYRIITISQ